MFSILHTVPGLKSETTFYQELYSFKTLTGTDDYLKIVLTRLQISKRRLPEILWGSKPGFHFMREIRMDEFPAYIFRESENPEFHIQKENHFFS